MLFASSRHTDDFTVPVFISPFGDLLESVVFIQSPVVLCCINIDTHSSLPITTYLRSFYLLPRLIATNHYPFSHLKIQVFIYCFIKDASLHHLVGRLLAPMHRLRRIGVEFVLLTIVVDS